MINELPGGSSIVAALDDHSRSLVLTDEERHAIRLYQSDQPAFGDYHWHNLMNAFLRDERLPGVDERNWRRVAKLVTDVQSAVAKSHLPVGVTVWRGVSRVQDVDALASPLGLESLEGVEIVLDGFVSCSMDRDTATRFAHEPTRLLLEIDVPVDATALWVSPWGPSRLRKQREVLLDDETTIKLTKLVSDADDMTRVVCEVQP